MQDPKEKLLAEATLGLVRKVIKETKIENLERETSDGLLSAVRGRGSVLKGAEKLSEARESAMFQTADVMHRLIEGYIRGDIPEESMANAVFENHMTMVEIMSEELDKDLSNYAYDFSLINTYHLMQDLRKKLERIK